MALNRKKHKTFFDDELSSTAFLTLYPRIFTEIPYSRLLYDLVSDSIEILDSQIKLIDYKKPFLAPELEYRYKVIDEVINSSSFDVIVEIGSGFSTRGLNFSKKGVDYLEVDLIDISTIKNKIYNQLLYSKGNDIVKVPMSISGSVLIQKTWQEIRSYISNRKALFINEGLMRYFNKNQKTYVGRQIATVIKKTGGAWITADVTLDRLLNFQKKTVLNKKNEIDEFVTKRSSEYTFSSLNNARDFFHKITGLKIITHKPDHLFLHSIQALGLTNKETNRIIEHVYIFEIQ